MNVFILFKKIDIKLIVIIIGVLLGFGFVIVKVFVDFGEWYVIMVCRDFLKVECVVKFVGMFKENYIVMYCDLFLLNSVK